jgi:hypothetical protein
VGRPAGEALVEDCCALGADSHDADVLAHEHFLSTGLWGRRVAAARVRGLTYRPFWARVRQTGEI